MGEFNQPSFKGGMNLLVDDTRIGPDEYREAFNVRNRFDVLDQVLTAEEQTGAPQGTKQGIFTFGDYLLMFVFGEAWYQLRGTQGWTLIQGFQMNPFAQRVYVAVVPVSTTNYGRLASDNTPVPNNPIKLSNVSAALGNAPGIVVQDGSTQPYFIWVDNSGIHTKQTQTYAQWFYDPTGVNDRREYVPIGTFMEWMDGVLFILATDQATLLRSVTGRPLDFVINVDKDGQKGGDAFTTGYSVGVGQITCLKALSSGGLFVSAANAVCFAVTFNRNPGAPTLFGEATFIRQLLFSAGCVSDRVFVDILGDSAFVDPEGLRSFNAVLQLQNEGRNSIFSLKVAKLFDGVIQKAETTAAIVFDNYALFSLNSIYGNIILVYDTLNKCFTSIDTVTGGKAIKQFAKIDTNVTQLYAITQDDKLLRLYSGTEFAVSTVRLGGLCSQNPKQELQPNEFRCVLNGFRLDSTITVRAFVNNRVSGDPITRRLKFNPSVRPYTGSPAFVDVDSQVNNVTFNFTGANQGWKVFFVINWTGGGSVTNIQSTTQELTPVQPLLTQGIS